MNKLLFAVLINLAYHIKCQSSNNSDRTIAGIVNPVIECQIKSCDKLTISLIVDSKKITLQLYRNKYSMSNKFVKELGTQTRRLGDSTEPQNTFYLGQDPIYKAAFQVYGVIVTGTFIDEGTHYEIEFDDTHNRHIIKHEIKKVQIQQRALADQEICISNESVEESDSIYADFMRPSNRALPDFTGQYYVELLVVNDHHMYKDRFRSDIVRLIDFNYLLINEINSLTSQLNVHIVLIGIETWQQGSKVTINPSGNAINDTRTLSNLLVDYSTKNYYPKYRYDAVLFMVGLDIGVVGENHIFGHARNSRICRSDGAVTVFFTEPIVDPNPDIKYRPRSLQDLSITAVHELGHLLSLQHLDQIDANCACYNKNQNNLDHKYCIMGPPTDNSLRQTWSQCSRTNLTRFAMRGRTWCINELPQSFIETGYGICGNGIIEGKEQCDCQGSDDICRRCCDLETCQLKTGIQCASGQCCANCMFMAQVDNVTCRPVFGDPGCQIQSACNGQSSDCPAARLTADGIACVNQGNPGLCLEGFCRTRSEQCQFLYGANLQSCPAQSYQSNTDATISGNCGIVNGDYRKCAPADVECGQLRCAINTVAEQRTSILYVRRLESQVTVTDIGNNCFTVDFNDNQNYGLTRDGTMCGAQSMCFNQTCLPIGCLYNCHGNGVCSNGQCQCKASFNPPFCKKPCPENCNGQGVCRPDGNCVCAEGYSPPYCTLPNVGISTLGPVVVNKKSSSLSVLNIVLLAVVLTLAIILTGFCLMYKRRADREHELELVEHVTDVTLPGNTSATAANPQTTVIKDELKLSGCTKSSPAANTSSNILTLSSMDDTVDGEEDEDEEDSTKQEYLM